MLPSANLSRKPIKQFCRTAIILGPILFCAAYSSMNSNAYGKKPTGETGERYAVVIGISDYQHKDIPDLRFAVKDARDFYNFLLDPQLGGFKESNVKLLLDDKASLINIKKELGIFLARKAGRDDLVLIYFAGHGAPETDMSGAADDGIAKYLIPYEADPTLLFATALDMAEVEKIFKRIDSEKLICFLDCCYSGASGSRSFSGMSLQGRGVRISEQFLNDLAPRGSGRVLITASKANEVAMELPKLKNGLFTYHLLQALKGKGDVNNDGYVTVKETYDFLEDRVARTSRREGGNQHPQMIGSISGKIVLASYYPRKIAPPPAVSKEMSAVLKKQADLEEELEKLNALKDQIEILKAMLKKAESTPPPQAKPPARKETPPDKQVAAPKQEPIQIDEEQREKLEDNIKEYLKEEKRVEKNIEKIKKRKVYQAPISF